MSKKPYRLFHLILPNRIHGIIRIVTEPFVRTGHGLSLPITPADAPVGTRHGVSLHDVSLQTLLHHDLPMSSEYNEFGKTIPGSLAVIIGQLNQHYHGGAI